jgi:outer membrane lipoprotein SlyB
VIGAAVSVTAEVIADEVTDRPVTLRKVVGAAFGGAIIGGSLGAATGEGIALQIAIAGDAGVVAGVAERAVKTGSMEEATGNPVEIATDFAANAAGEGVVQAGESLVKKAAGGAVRALEEQSGTA